MFELVSPAESQFFSKLDDAHYRAKLGVCSIEMIFCYFRDGQASDESYLDATKKAIAGLETANEGSLSEATRGYFTEATGASGSFEFGGVHGTSAHDVAFKLISRLSADNAFRTSLVELWQSVDSCEVLLTKLDGEIDGVRRILNYIPVDPLLPIDNSRQPHSPKEIYSALGCSDKQLRILARGAGVPIERLPTKRNDVYTHGDYLLILTHAIDGGSSDPHHIANAKRLLAEAKAETFPNTRNLPEVV